MLRKLIAGLCLAALLACPADARRIWLLGKNSSAQSLPATAKLVFEGDSITLGLFCAAPLNYPTRVILQLPSGPAYTNNTIATSGISSLTLQQNYATRGGASFNSSFAMNMLLFMSGTNTSGASDTNAGQKYFFNRDYIRQARNSGYQRVVLGTLIAKDGDAGAFWTSTIVPLNVYQRTYYNSDMQSDFLMDWGNFSPYFTPFTAADNFTYYNTDFIHPIPAGCQQMANLAAPAITSALGAAGSKQFAPATWSPFSQGTGGNGGYDGTTTLSGDFRTAAVPSGSAQYGIRGFPGAHSGKFYWEVGIVASAVSATVGLVNDYFPFNNAAALGQDAAHNSIGYSSFDGSVRIGNATITTLASVLTGDIIGEAADFDAKLIWLRRCRSGVCQSWNGNGSADPATGIGGISISTLQINGVGDRFYPAGGVNSGADSIISRFAASQLTQSVPSGFSTFAP